MGIRLDLIGQRFGRLVVKKYVGNNKHNSAVWLCVCDCGNNCNVNSSKLNAGNTKSCGCLKVELAGKQSILHGLSGSSEYNIWKMMKARCSNPNNIHYINYGGRGIYVCERWLNSFENFYVDMGKRPSRKYSLDRIDNDGPYSPENCRWATRKEQNNNTRSNIVLTYKNESLTLSQWARKLNINYHTLYRRLNDGWTIEEALNTPVNKRKGS